VHSGYPLRDIFYRTLKFVGQYVLNLSELFANSSGVEKILDVLENLDVS